MPSKLNPKFTILLTLSLLALLQTSLAEAKSKPKTPDLISDRSCAFDKDDKYEDPIRLGTHSGKYSGRCLDTSELREARTLSESNSIFKVANIRHDGRFWTASFPKADNEIQAVEYLVVREGFLITSGHTQMMITFKKPVKLRSQTDSSKTTYVRNFVYSVEASFPKGVSYSIVDGLGTNYPLIGRVLSAQQRIQEDLKAKYKRYPMRLGYQEKAQLLALILKQAPALSEGRYYNTFKNNCTTALVSLVDQLPRFANYQLGFGAVIGTDPIIGHSVNAMKKRGLLEKPIAECGPEVKDCRYGQSTFEILD